METYVPDDHTYSVELSSTVGTRTVYKHLTRFDAVVKATQLLDNMHRRGCISSIVSPCGNIRLSKPSAPYYIVWCTVE